jgi:hypothetical protein
MQDGMFHVKQRLMPGSGLRRWPPGEILRFAQDDRQRRWAGGGLFHVKQSAYGSLCCLA